MSVKEIHEPFRGQMRVPTGQEGKHDGLWEGSRNTHGNHWLWELGLKSTDRSEMSQRQGPGGRLHNRKVKEIHEPFGGSKSFRKFSTYKLREFSALQINKEVSWHNIAQVRGYTYPASSQSLPLFWRSRRRDSARRVARLHRSNTN